MSGRLNQLIALAALLVLASLAVALYVANRPVGAGASTSALAGLAADAHAAAAGDVQAADRLKRDVAALREQAAGNERLANVLSNVEAVIAAAPQVAAANVAAQQARELVATMQADIDALAATLSGPVRDAAARPLERFEMRAQQVATDLFGLAAGVAEPGAAARRLAEATDYLSQVIKGLRGTDTALGLERAPGQAAETRLGALEKAHAQLAAAVRSGVDAASAPPAAKAAATAVGGDVRALAGSLPAPGEGISAFVWWPVAPGAAALIVLAILWLGFARVRVNEQRQAVAADAQRQENDRNQQSILRLLDELSSLADGDLTVQATVTEDITGAIADSINFAVEALRGLVSTINGSAIHLESATRQTQALAQHLAKASGAQSKQIASATETASAVAGLTEEVSNNAERASDVARHSVDVAHKGGDAVRRTIDGMNTIRETIQETSKRIKRLGESSQEIGNIVELINDIAEQTNILALNASIQASMAGEAGRGFAVVADEVQRLAERAANATKQIEVLVRTIQTDTNEAVVSMERSTTDVVGGALLAENAGAALEEIEQVSNQIASLVQNISASSRQQTSAAQNIARSMQVLKEISAQTADSTSATSVAIAKLAELSGGLRKSASGFRLPGSPTATPAPAPVAPGAKRKEDEKSPVRPLSAVGSS
jgi:twitching motility protein PilJ